MTPAERAAMRETLQKALGRALLPGASAEHPGAYPQSPGQPDVDPVERFRAELSALGGEVHEAADTAGVATLIAGILAANSTHPRTVLAWDDEQLPVPGLGAALTSMGISVIRQQPGDLSSAEARAQLASATVGVTGAVAALVETGSVVLASGPGRGRLASLLPLVHVALVRRDSFIGSLPELLARQPRLVELGANIVCITGPSRTADIEHTLSRGVHGPRDIHVVVLSSGAAGTLGTSGT